MNTKKRHEVRSDPETLERECSLVQTNQKSLPTLEKRQEERRPSEAN